MGSDKVQFTGSGGNQLSGVLETPSGEIRGWAVFAHCFTCSKTSLASTRIARGLAARGIGVLRFDFTGLGESDGDFSDTGFSTNVEDLVAANEWMAEQGRVVKLLIGHSLGGAASVVAASSLPEVAAVATIGAPSDAGHVIKQFAQHVPEIEAKGEALVDLGGRPFVLRRSILEGLEGNKVIEAVSTLKRPILVMHSPLDETVSIENATALFVNARHPKSFVSLDHANHLLTRAEDADFAVSLIAGWSQRYIAASDKSASGRSVAAETAEARPGEVLVRESGAAGPYQNDVFAAGQHYFADEPLSVGGAGTGPDPYDWVSGGLGACTSMTLRMYAQRKGWLLQRVSVTLDHQKKHKDDCVYCGPKDRVDVFTREIALEGDLTDEQRARLLEIADRCPVHRTLEHGAVIETRLAILSA